MVSFALFNGLVILPIILCHIGPAVAEKTEKKAVTIENENNVLPEEKKRSAEDKKLNEGEEIELREKMLP